MKKFIQNILLFIIICFISINIFSYVGHIIVTYTDINFFNTTDYKVGKTIKKSKSKKKVKVLVLGDSVADQLYGKSSDSTVYAVTTTIAITLVGQYILLHNFLVANKDQLPEKVVLLINPSVLESNIVNQYSYNLFLRSFYNNEYVHLLDNDVKSEMKHMPFYYLTQYNWYKHMSYVPSYSMQSSKKTNKLFCDIQLNYLNRIIELCIKNNIKFELYSDPIKESNKKSMIKYITYKGNNVTLNKFFNTIRFYADSMFIDNAHFKQEYIPIDYLQLYN